MLGGLAASASHEVGCQTVRRAQLGDADAQALGDGREVVALDLTTV
jgi:hypothetical protein